MVKRKISKNRFDKAIAEIGFANKNEEGMVEQKIPKSFQKIFHQNRHDQLEQLKYLDDNKFTKRLYENDSVFKHRIDKKTREVILQSKLESKYGCNLDDINTSDIKIKCKSDQRKNKDKARKREKTTRKILKVQDKIQDFSLPREIVNFGEIVSCPPQLTKKPKLKPLFQKKTSFKDLQLFSMLNPT